MFDDKPIAPQGPTPPNLPLGEPEDVFAGTAELHPPEMPAAGLPPATSATSALDAGILKPKDPFVPQPVNPSSFSSQAMPSANAPSAMPPLDQMSLDQNASMNTLKEPTMSRGILIAIVVILALLLLGGAGWWVYRYLNVAQAPVPSTDSETTTAPVVETPPATSGDDSNQVAPSTGETSTADQIAPTQNTSSTEQSADETILFGESLDTDADGLDDKREQTLGTNPQKSDTDGDELSDGDEVIIWGTNPLVADTDGDGYSDGKEVKSGFSPKGPGKLFEVKPTSQTTSSSQP